MKKETTHDPDPFDGVKAVGCLFVGSALLAIVLFLFGELIKYLK